MVQALIFESKHKTSILKRVALLISLLISFSTFCQKSVDCKDYKQGVFYDYEKNSTNVYVIYRIGDEQKEVNLTTGDSAFWKIEWNDDCTYTLKLKSTSFKWNAETMKFLKDHKFIYTILKTTNEYYTYKGSVDNASNPKIIEDTAWFLEKSTPTNSELFKPLKNEVEVRKMKDTSQYAILYLYRPGKITNSLGNYGIFFDNVAMCVARNNTGYIFKILREGKFPISSRLMKDESTVNVDIKFGQIYYVKSMIHWTISSRLYNFKLEMAKMDPVRGAVEFEEIENR